MVGRPKGSSRYATAKAFAKYLYESSPGLGPDRIEQVMRRSDMPAHDIPSVEAIKKWTKPWERGSVEQESWDFLAASAADRKLMVRYVVATSELTQHLSISRVMVPEGVDPKAILPPVGSPQWPSAAVAEWFVALATWCCLSRTPSRQSRLTPPPRTTHTVA